MTDPKGRSTKEQSRQRQLRRLAVKAAKESGKHVEGKQVHHKNGNRKDNSPDNLSMIDIKAHGAKHGRGHKKPTK
jgi:hypothetical protein